MKLVSMHTIRNMMAITLLALAATGSWAAEKGSFGFAVAVESEVMSLNPMNPTLKSVSVAKVQPGSPAEAAGLLAGDQVMEIEGQPVAGAKANDLKSHLSKNVGETVILKVKKASGEVLSYKLSAGKVAAAN
jgi:C-terminal processing protease CtpA/Prc